MKLNGMEWYGVAWNDIGGGMERHGKSWNDGVKWQRIYKDVTTVLLQSKSDSSIKIGIKLQPAQEIMLRTQEHYH